MKARHGTGAAAALMLLAAAGGTAEARVQMIVRNKDGADKGFNDPTPATPVGGNTGTTVGEQRLKAFQYAADLWGQALDGTVPVEIDANFAPLSCSASVVTLGNARPAQFVSNNPGLPPNMWFPVPLANQIAGVDLYLPGGGSTGAEIQAMFNGALAECAGAEADWYYGFDGKGGDLTDLVSVVLHELAHGLGFTTLLDPRDGFTLPNGRIDIYSTHIFDVTQGKAWTDLTSAQKVTSSANIRRVVWDGANVTHAAPGVLAKGNPFLRLTPTPGGVVGFVSEAEFGPRAADKPVTGRVVSVTASAIGGCAISGSLVGAVVLFSRPACAAIQEAGNAQDMSGAAAVLITDGRGVSPPFSVGAPLAYRSLFNVTVPVLGISDADAARIAGTTGAINAEIGGDGTRLVGADEMGRVYLYVSNPVDIASSLAHWDILARPDLLEEPESPTEAPHDLRLEQALLRDIGWGSLCGNGTMDPGEQCDQGSMNGTQGSTCRSDCTTGAAGPGTGGASGGTGGRGGSGGGTGGRGGTSGGSGGRGGAPGGGGSGTGGSVTSGAGGSVATGTGGAAAGSGGSGGGDGGGGGCGCHVDGDRASSLGAIFFAGVALALSARCRRTRRR